MHELPTVKVVLPGNPRGYKIINESDLSPDDKIFGETPDPPDPPETVDPPEENQKTSKKNKGNSR